MQARSKAAPRYARALFAIARQGGELDAVREDLGAVARLVHSSAELQAFLRNYTLGRSVRSKALTELFASRVRPLTFRLLAFMESKRRLSMLPDVCGRFLELCDRERGVAPGQLTTAFNLEPVDVQAIAARTEARAGTRVELTANLDPSLLGGFQVQVGDTLYDLSVATRLRRLKSKMTQAATAQGTQV